MHSEFEQVPPAPVAGPPWAQGVEGTRGSDIKGVVSKSQEDEPHRKLPNTFVRSGKAKPGLRGWGGGRVLDSKWLPDILGRWGLRQLHGVSVP